MKHAEFKIHGDFVKIADVGSTNGTKVKGEVINEAGVELSEKSKVLLGETIPAYIVSAADLEGSSPDDLIKFIEEAEESAGAKTEPVAPVATAVPAATPVAPVKPGAVELGAVAAPAAPAASGATTVKLSAVKPNNGPALTGGGKPPAPAIASPPKPAAPAVPTPAGGPVAPKPIAPASPGEAKPVAPVPLKRPGAEGGPKPVPLPKTPPKP